MFESGVGSLQKNQDLIDKITTRELWLVNSPNPVFLLNRKSCLSQNMPISVKNETVKFHPYSRPSFQPRSLHSHTNTESRHSKNTNIPLLTREKDLNTTNITQNNNSTIGNSQFICPNCNVDFINRDTLAMHMMESVRSQACPGVQLKPPLQKSQQNMVNQSQMPKSENNSMAMAFAALLSQLSNRQTDSYTKPSVLERSVPIMSPNMPPKNIINNPDESIRCQRISLSPRPEAVNQTFISINKNKNYTAEQRTDKNFGPLMHMWKNMFMIQNNMELPIHGMEDYFLKFSPFDKRTEIFTDHHDNKFESKLREIFSKIGSESLQKLGTYEQDSSLNSRPYSALQTNHRMKEIIRPPQSKSAPWSMPDFSKTIETKNENNQQTNEGLLTAKAFIHQNLQQKNVDQEHITNNIVEITNINTELKDKSHRHQEEVAKTYDFHCKHCDIGFKDQTLYSLHMGLHTVTQPWQCNMCGKMFRGRHDFTAHSLHF